MDARTIRLGACCAALLLTSLAQAAQYSTSNFVVTAPTEQLARRVANCAEHYRRELALSWLGEPLPNWYKPCPISVRVGQIGAGGQTTFTFENGEVFGWRMEVQGTEERILDSVIPHEVNHTIFASHFRRPMPRWADEGAATLFEHESERLRQTKLLDQVLRTPRRIPLNELLTIREYPPDMQDVLTLYAEGYSLASFLVGAKGDEGRQVFLEFLADSHKHGWQRAINKHYGFESISDLEENWTDWILAGSPEFDLPEGQMLAQADNVQSGLSDAPEAVIRGQSPDVEAAPAHVETAGHADPIRPIPRQLRAGRNPGGAGVSEPQTSYDRSTTATNSSRSLRSREGDQLDFQSSLPPSTLSPTANELRTDTDAECYQFPSARRKIR